MIALIVADGDVPDRTAVARLLDGRRPEFVVGADGGALKAATLGYPAHVVVGDADSLPAGSVAQLRAAGAEVIIHPADKDQSDTELAVLEALERGASALLIIGAFGGRRLEHTIANLLLLCLPALAGRDVRLADGASVIRLVEPGPGLVIDGGVGDFVSLLPLAPQVTGVSTTGLGYQLADDTLSQGPARGLSNVMSAARATVRIGSGRLLAVHTLADG